MEGQLGDKPYLMGDSFGYALETIGNISIEKECPKLVAWVKRCKERKSVSMSLADPHKIYEFALQLQKKYGI